MRKQAIRHLIRFELVQQHAVREFVQEQQAELK